MLKKLLFYVFGTCACVGFIIVLGTAGSHELGRLAFGEIMRNIAVGFGLMLIGAIGTNATECQ